METQVRESRGGDEFEAVAGLKQSVVCLRHNGQLLGTGFFVGSDLVATCAHLLNLASKFLDEVGVECGAEKHLCRVSRRETRDSHNDIPFPDIAIIQWPSNSGKALELEESFQPGDHLYAWGFSREAPHGDSIEGECEYDRNFGPGDSRRLIKLKNTQITPGLSGSPVLNLRTGKICGMMKRTRDEASDAGGYAVRAAELLRLPEIDDAQRRLETRLRRELRAYLKQAIDDSGKLPRYFPNHLIGFDQIRQRVRVVSNLATLYGAVADERERRRSAGDWYDAYDPLRARPEERSLDHAKDEEEYSRNKWAGGPVPSEPRIETIDWEQVRSEKRFSKLVILGDAGFGKTWLLRHETRRRAIESLELLDSVYPQNLTVPIMVKLQDLANQVASTQTFTETLDKAMESRGMSNQLRSYFGAQIRAGRVALFLDAWDEVSGDRHKLLEQVEVWSQSCQGTVLLTSRPAQFGRSPLGEAEVVELMAFERSEIDAFAKVWFEQVTAGKFLAALDRDRAVNGLARIPLMLSLLCRIYQEPNRRESGKHLPLRRVELYEGCLKGLLKDWKRTDKAEEADSGDDLSFEITRDNCARAALALYPASQFSGSDFGKNFTDRILALNLIRDLIRDGVLTIAGHLENRDAWFLFLHRTFHEYLAARQWASESWDDRLLDERSRNVVWQPVIVLMAGLLPREGAERLISHLAREKTDGPLRPKLALAIACLREMDEKDRNSGTVDEVTTEALELWQYHFRGGTSSALVSINAALPILPDLGGRYKGVPISAWIMRLKDVYFLNLLSALGPSAATQEVVDRLLKLTRSTDIWSPSRAVEVIGNLGEKAATAQVLERLAELGTEVSGLSDTADKALEKLARKAASPEVFGRLLKPSDAGVHWGVVKAIGSVGEKAATPEVVERLLELTHHGGWWLPVRSLGNLGENAATPEVLARLLQLMRDAYSFETNAEQALMKLIKKAPTSEVLEGLRQLVIDGNSEQRWKAIQVLKQLDDNTIAQKILPQLLRASYDAKASARSRAAEALGHLGRSVATPEVVSRVLHLLRDHRQEVRSAAALAIGNMGLQSATLEVLDGLVGLTRDVSIWVCNDAVKALGLIGRQAATSEVLDRLLELSREASTLLRPNVVEALGRLSEESVTPEVQHRLLELSHDPDDKVRERAASALNNLANMEAEPNVLARLVDLIGDADGNVRWAGRWALQRLSHKAAIPEVLAPLLELTRNRNDDVRSEATSALGDLCEKVATPELLAHLMELIQDPNDKVRLHASMALTKLGERAATPKVVARLMEIIRGERQQGRFEAALALGSFGESVATPEVLAQLVVLIRGSGGIAKRGLAWLLELIREELMIDTNGDARGRAMLVLEKLGENASATRVVPLLLELTRSMNGHVRSRAIDALGTLGDKAATPEVFGRLLELLRGWRWDIRWTAASVLGELQRVAPNVRIPDKKENRFMRLVRFHFWFRR